MNDELRPEYDLTQLLKGGVRGKYARRYHAGTNLVLLDPDVRKAFRSERSVKRRKRGQTIVAKYAYRGTQPKCSLESAKLTGH